MAKQQKELLEIGKLLRDFNKKHGYYHTSIFVIGGSINGMVFNEPDGGIALDIYSDEDENE